MTHAVDLMTHLLEKYREVLHEQKQRNADKGLESQVEPDFHEFIDFARNYLAKENQPMNVTYMPQGLGLILQQGQLVCFTEQKTAIHEMHDEGIRISRPSTIPGMHGVIRGGEVPITGR